MDRLTRDNDRSDMLVAVLKARTYFDAERIGAILERCKEYEQTGITPEQIESAEKSCIDTFGAGLEMLPKKLEEFYSDLIELVEYRKTELTPEQIFQMDKDYTEMATKVHKRLVELVTCKLDLS